MTLAVVIINRYNLSFDNFVYKVNVSLSSATGELHQNRADIITKVTYELLNIKILRQRILSNKKKKLLLTKQAVTEYLFLRTTTLTSDWLIIVY